MRKMALLAMSMLGVMAGSVSAERRSSRSTYGTYGTGSNARSTRVDGYTKRDGTYVAPHQRTSPNGTQRDNYNTRGNYNPSTGKTGKTWATK